MSVKIFADGADIGDISALSRSPIIKGFTTNPTLMRKSGVADYESFAREVLAVIAGRPISFEIFADDFDEMEAQAMTISSWGSNVYVKVPVTNTAGSSTAALVSRLSRRGVKVNVTAVMTLEQVSLIADSLDPETPAVVSVFAGRIADTGVDPMPMMAQCAKLLAPKPRAQLLWASPREVLNIFHADEVGCHIITATSGLLSKLVLIGKDLAQYSLETVEMFHRDALGAGYEILEYQPTALERPAAEVLAETLQ